MNNNQLCIRACMYAISTLIDKGSSAFGTSTEFVTDDGCIEKRFTTIEWSEVLDWLDNQVSAEYSILEQIKAEIPNLVSYESADGQDLVMAYDILRLIDEHITNSKIFTVKSEDKE